MSDTTTTELRDGDVVRYQPSRTWCRDGVAKAITHVDGTVVLYDTYWHTPDHGSRVPADASFEVLFNLHDYDRTEEWHWSRRAPADRRIIRAQHGYCTEFYIRKGSVESPAQIVENARHELEEAREELRQAEHRVKVREWALTEAEKAAGDSNV